MKFKFILIFLLLICLCVLNCAYFVSDYRTKKNTSVCEIHNIAFQTKTCWIQYGLILDNYERNDSAYVNAFYKAFNMDFKNAHSRSTVLGGCLVKPQKWAKIYYCPLCNKAQSEWFELHKVNQPQYWKRLVR